MQLMAKPVTVLAAVASLLLLVPFGAVVVAQTDVTGTWAIALTTQAGETNWTANFTQDGERLLGEIDLGDREILSLEGTVQGSTIEFTFVVPDLDGDQPIDLSGEVMGDTIKGDNGSFVWFGRGDWTAAKQAS
jgi:hypothetical protein